MWRKAVGKYVSGLVSFRFRNFPLDNVPRRRRLTERLLLNNEENSVEELDELGDVVELEDTAHVSLAAIVFAVASGIPIKHGWEVRG